MEVSGKVKKIYEAQTFDSGFKKRELVVTTQEQYPQHILIEFLQERADLLNEVNVGDDIKVSINLRGREWVNPQGETKYFNSITGWRIEKMTSESVATNSIPTQQNYNNIAPAQMPINSESNLTTTDGDDDDLPF